MKSALTQLARLSFVVMIILGLAIQPQSSALSSQFNHPAGRLECHWAG